MSPLLLFTLAILNVVDASITTHFLSLNGRWYEANPILNFGIGVFGLSFIWLFKAFSLSMLGAGIYFYEDAKWLENVLIALNVIYLIVVVYSVTLLF